MAAILVIKVPPISAAKRKSRSRAIIPSQAPLTKVMLPANSKNTPSHNAGTACPMPKPPSRRWT